MAQILVVDDEARIRDVVQYSLEREGHDVRLASDGEQALRLVAERPFDLMVLDVLMPEMDGLSVCRELRKTSRLPIIFLSSRAEEVDRILGLELGGDDYVTKPFSPRELCSRVKAVLRRAGAESLPDGDPAVVELGELSLDPRRHAAQIAGRELALTATEFALLLTLLSSPRQVFTRDQLIDRLRGDDVHLTDRTIDSHVRRIRSKLRPHALDPIETVRGVGYRAAQAPR